MSDWSRCRSRQLRDRTIGVAQQKVYTTAAWEIYCAHGAAQTHCSPKYTSQYGSHLVRGLQLVLSGSSRPPFFILYSALRDFLIFKKSFKMSHINDYFLCLSKTLKYSLCFSLSALEERLQLACFFQCLLNFYFTSDCSTGTKFLFLFIFNIFVNQSAPFCLKLN